MSGRKALTLVRIEAVMTKVTSVGEAIPFGDKKALEDVACYMVRNPLSLRKRVYLDGQKAVLYRSKMNPFLGRNFEAMDPLEWLARRLTHAAPRP